MLNKEKVERFKNEKIAIHCETKEEAKSFVKWCLDNGIKWLNRELSTTYFDEYKDKTCYSFLGEFKCLEYSQERFYKEHGYEIIKYKDFMVKKKMTKLEYAASKGEIDECHTLCHIAHICKYGESCGIKRCKKCEFDENVELCIKTLLEEHRKTIKLKQYEYDLLDVYNDKHEIFRNFEKLNLMKKKGYFKDIVDTMTIQEILYNCEVTK